MLDLRRLQVLKAVVDAGSITGAARALGYTPSAISQSISSLERSTQAVLFEKAGRGIRPTQEALLLARHAEALGEGLAEAEAALEALRAGESGRLRVAAFATAGGALVPRAFALFRQACPGVEIEFVMAETDDALKGLEAGHIDVGVVAQTGEVVDHSPALLYAHLLRDPYRVVLPAGHPKARSRTLELADLSNEDWIATESARCNCLPTVTEACARAGFTANFTIEADEFATTVGFVGAGLGVALVPALALSAVPQDVAVRRVRGEPAREVYAVTRRTTGGQAIVTAMTDALLRSARTHLRSAA